MPSHCQQHSRNQTNRGQAFFGLLLLITAMSCGAFATHQSGVLALLPTLGTDFNALSDQPAQTPDSPRLLMELKPSDKPAIMQEFDRVTKSQPSFLAESDTTSILDLVAKPVQSSPFQRDIALGTANPKASMQKPSHKNPKTSAKKQRKIAGSKIVSLEEIDRFLALKHEKYNYIDKKYFLKNTDKLLPKYELLFKKAAKKHNLDWRLVAAIAYQESVWDPNAVSPTGVKGMMMLTRITAKEMGVTDRTDVKESIFGGTGYFQKLLKRIPAEVSGPDRTLMALAAYNMGYGHIIAARNLTKKQGGDNTSWKDVAKRVALLQDPKYYKQSRYGYARGAKQALHYVDQIQKHYDMLLMLTERDKVAEGRISTMAITGFALARY